MFAIIKTGGKQYKVTENQYLEIEKLPVEVGEEVEFTDVLMIGGDDVKLGQPFVEGAKVTAEVIEQKRGKKVVAFKFKKRKGYRKKKGHRQPITVIKVKSITA